MKCTLSADSLSDNNTSPLNYRYGEIRLFHKRFVIHKLRKNEDGDITVWLIESSAGYKKIKWFSEFLCINSLKLYVHACETATIIFLINIFSDTRIIDFSIDLLQIYSVPKSTSINTKFFVGFSNLLRLKHTSWAPICLLIYVITIKNL